MINLRIRNGCYRRLVLPSGDNKVKKKKKLQICVYARWFGTIIGAALKLEIINLFVSSPCFPANLNPMCGNCELRAEKEQNIQLDLRWRIFQSASNIFLNIHVKDKRLWAQRQPIGMHNKHIISKQMICIFTFIQWKSSYHF